MLWRASARRYQVLGIRDFRLLLGDRLLAMSAVGFSLVGVSFAVLNATGSPTDLSYVLAAQIAPTLVFTLLGGVLADRISPQGVLIAANLAIMTGEGGFGILVLTTHPPLWAMIALESLTGTGAAMLSPSQQALLPRVVPAELLQEASSISRLAMNTARWAAPRRRPRRRRGGAGLGAARVRRLHERHDPDAAEHPRAPEHQGRDASEQPPSMLRELREGWTEFRSHTWLWATSSSTA